MYGYQKEKKSKKGGTNLKNNQVQKLIYLGSVLTKNRKCGTETQIRSGLANKTFQKLRNVLKNWKVLRIKPR